MKGDKSKHPNGHDKCSAEELKYRIELCVQWLLDNPNLRAKDFNDYCNQMWGIEKRRAFDYKKMAYKNLNVGAEEKTTADRKLAISSLKKQFIAAEKDGKTDLCFKIQTEINKLQGLHTMRIEQKIEGEMPLFNVDSIPHKEEDE